MNNSQIVEALPVGDNPCDPALALCTGALDFLATRRGHARPSPGGYWALINGAPRR